MLYIALLVSLPSCGKKTLLDRVEEEYGKGNYREVVFLVRHHFRQGGERSPQLLFISGKALLRMGIEADAGASFAEIYSADTTWAPQIAALFQEEAILNLENGSIPKGKRMMVQAVNYQSKLDFGKYNAVAGEILLEQKDYEKAIYFFESYLDQCADTTGAAGVMMNLGSAYESQGEKLKAIELYRLFRERYPKSRLASTARWRLENLLLSTGEELYSGGESDEAENLLLDLASSAGNPLVRERANFMLGEIFESKFEIERAVHYYTEVVNLNLGSSGRLAEKAKERIVKLEKARALR